MSTSLAMPAPAIVTAPAPSVAVAPPKSGFMQQAWPIYVMLGSFFVLTLPLSILALADPNFITTYRWPIAIYVVVLGTTHFLLTLTVYLQSKNLKHFNSSWRNRIYYFLIPVLIFVLFDLYSALEIAVLFPVFALVFRAGLRLLDFHHFTRQSFGVTQLLKGRARQPFVPWLKKIENAFFISLTALIFITFLNGGSFDATHVPTLLALGIVVPLFVTVLVGFALTWRKAPDRAAVGTPLTYFLLHSAALGLAAYSTPLYVFSLAMHYVEYHILMVPRCFNAPLDETQTPDRILSGLRRNKFVFYGLLILAAAMVYVFTLTSMGTLLFQADRNGTPTYLVLISLFDGLFVFHYFIEAFIWKFSDPFYRQSLGPLYFNTSKPAAAR